MTHILSVEYNTEEIGSIKTTESLFHLKDCNSVSKPWKFTVIPIAVDYAHYRLLLIIIINKLIMFLLNLSL